MPTEIFLINENAEPQYETILPEEKTDKDVVVETIIEEAKTEEKENENGEKEIVEVSPRTEKLKILKRPFPSTISILCGRSIPTSAPRRNTKSSTARYLTITRSPCSGST